MSGPFSVWHFLILPGRSPCELPDGEHEAGVSGDVFCLAVSMKHRNKSAHVCLSIPSLQFTLILPELVSVTDC